MRRARLSNDSLGLIMIGSREITEHDMRTNPWIPKVVADIRVAFPERPKKPKDAPKSSNKAQLVPLAEEKDRGPPHRCLYNAHNYTQAHPGSRMVRTFKLWSECSRDRKIQAGCKGVMHYIVRLADGVLLDPTHEPGDRYTFNVPAQWYPEIEDDQLRCGGALHMGGFILGELHRVNFVLSTEGEDTLGSVATVPSVAEVYYRLVPGIPPQPWGGIALEGEKKAIARAAEEMKVQVATIYRWIEEAKTFCKESGTDYAPQADSGTAKDIAEIVSELSEMRMDIERAGGSLDEFDRMVATIYTEEAQRQVVEG